MLSMACHVANLYHNDFFDMKKLRSLKNLSFDEIFRDYGFDF